MRQTGGLPAGAWHPWGLHRQPSTHACGQNPLSGVSIGDIVPSQVSPGFSQLPAALPHRLDYPLRRDVVQVARRRRDGLVAELLRDNAYIHTFTEKFTGTSVT